MKFRWRYLVAALFLGLGVWLAAACGGGDEEEEEETPAATSVAEEGVEEGELTAPAAAFAELASYRYKMRLNIAGAEAEGGAFAFDVEGAFVAPDRTQVKVKGKLGTLDLQEETITIGGRTWVRGDGGWEEGEATFGSGDFSPASFLEDFDADELRVLKPTKETVNGVRSLRYKIGRADIEELAKLGALFGGEGGVEDLPKTFDIDLWLAEEGRWPVRLVMSATGEAEGGEFNFEFSMDVTDVNDESIEIEPPV